MQCCGVWECVNWMRPHKQSGITETGIRSGEQNWGVDLRTSSDPGGEGTGRAVHPLLGVRAEQFGRGLVGGPAFHNYLVALSTTAWQLYPCSKSYLPAIGMRRDSGSAKLRWDLTAGTPGCVPTFLLGWLCHRLRLPSAACRRIASTSCCNCARYC